MWIRVMVFRFAIAREQTASTYIYSYCLTLQRELVENKNNKTYVNTFSNKCQQKFLNERDKTSQTIELQLTERCGNRLSFSNSFVLKIFFSTCVHMNWILVCSAASGRYQNVCINVWLWAGFSMFFNYYMQ